LPKEPLFISFAPPKEMNQRKGGRKRQPQPPSLQTGSFAKIAHWAISLRSALPATQGLIGATKQAEVRAFSGLPARLKMKGWSLDYIYFFTQISLRPVEIQKSSSIQMDFELRRSEIFVAECISHDLGAGAGIY
jgi:hypothetical protein